MTGIHANFCCRESGALIFCVVCSRDNSTIDGVFMNVPNVGIVGATGAVGQKILTVLAARDLHPEVLRLFASDRSAGRRIPVNDREIVVESLEGADFSGLNVIFFATSTDLSRQFVPRAIAAGAVVIDNSNAFRMQADVPLVVPEVNPDALRLHRGLIANPNCSTIQMLVAIAPIHRVNPIRRIVVSTYQSVSGTGLEAVDLLCRQTRAMLDEQEVPDGVYAHPIGFNLFPHIDIFLESGLCREEEKMVLETAKILGEPVPICPTTVRVPVFFAHSEVINLELSNSFEVTEMRRLLAASPGIIVQDDPAADLYPTPLSCAERDEVFVGRIRRDPSLPNGLNMWVVADNLRRGAATNAVLIFQRLLSDKLLRCDGGGDGSDDRDDNGRGRDSYRS